jgi:Cu2+-exporting ATPase
VVSNALRLNLFSIRDASHDKKGKGAEIVHTEPAMERTIRIKGMMCGHCEARVKNALEALSEVEEAVVSHTAGTAVVSLKEAVDDSKLKEAIEEQMYQVLSIQ